jgi:carbonic anhydrase
MLSKIAFAVYTVYASEGAWNYHKNGADWPKLTIDKNECGNKANQSPINLVSRLSKDFKYKVYDAEKDAFTKAYSNAIDVNPKFNGHTNQVNLDVSATAPSNMFTSQVAAEIFGADTEFDGQQFHFHSGSEHTVDGKRYDLEMHTVHYPKKAENGYIAAAMGIIFSVEDYTAKLTWAEQEIINNFFDSLKWTDMTADGPTVDLVTYGSLMEMVDNNNRWVYKGSVTTPPCATNVYWNVLSTIYPISKKHLE